MDACPIKRIHDLTQGPQPSDRPITTRRPVGCITVTSDDSYSDQGSRLDLCSRLESLVSTRGRLGR